MATVRTALNEALRAIRAIGLGDDPVADELAIGLEAVQGLILDIHEGRGPLLDVDVTAATITPGENQRLRIQDGDTTLVTLPNAVPIGGPHSPYDYGFTAPAGAAPVGTAAVADGYAYRAPLDGSRIEIVGATQALYFYRSDTNAWTRATDLALDSELPFSARLTSAFSAMLAERLFDSVSTAPPTPMLLKRIAQGRLAMMQQSGKGRTQTVGQYL
jgi:hypothetical protein